MLCLALRRSFWRSRLILVLLISGLALPAAAAPAAAPPAPVTFTILHTNDFHGQLESVAAATRGWRARPRWSTMSAAAVGADNVLLVDAGDEMQGSLLSNLGDGRRPERAPTIATYNTMGYNVADLRQPRVRLGPDEPDRPDRSGRGSRTPTSPPTSSRTPHGQLRHGQLDRDAADDSPHPTSSRPWGPRRTRSRSPSSA